MIKLLLILLIMTYSTNSIGSEVDTIQQVTMGDLSGFVSDANDFFGYTLSSGDYNNDGFEDLAVGIPFMDIILFGADFINVGGVLVFYGAAPGINFSDNELLYQSVENELETNDQFGRSLATGDFDDDGFDDLAVGVPLEDVFDQVNSGENNAGVVNIFYGDVDGFSSPVFLNQGGFGGADVEANDRFGVSLTVGDFDGDGFDDLVVGVPYENFGTNDSVVDGGSITVFYGNLLTLDEDDSDKFSQNTFNILENSESGDLFGYSLASGDFDNDGFDDLAVGVPGEDVIGENSAGIVQILYGSFSGVSTNDFIFSQDGPINGIAEAFDEFGNSVASGDINNDGFDDLAVGVWKEDANQSGIVDIGGVQILYGSVSGITENNDQFLAQSNNNIIGTAANNDQFGESVLIHDLNNDGFGDVIIGTPDDTNFDGGGSVGPAGSVTILFGNENGISLNNEIYIVSPELGEMRGQALIAGSSYNDSSLVDLVVGVPGFDSLGNNSAGAIEVISLTSFDLIFKDSYE